MEIEFKALNSGLGFHPLTNELPYSPQQTPRPLPQTPVVVVPAPIPAKVEVVSVVVEEKLGFSYVARRILAFFIDFSFNTLLAALAGVFVFWKLHLDPTPFLKPENFVLAGLFVFLFSWTLVLAQEIIFHTSLGKLTAGLRLQGNVGNLVLRALGFIVSFSFLGLGLIWSIVDRKRRCWHDLLSGIQPNEVTQ